jgi:HSP20 family protein
MHMHHFIKIRLRRDFDHLQDRVRRFRHSLLEGHQSGQVFRPPADLYETAQGLVLRLELAGVKPEDIALTLAGQELAVQGRRQPPDASQVQRILRLEMSYGDFERRFTLPLAIDPQRVEARFQDGILTVHLPRLQPESRQIAITALPERG